MKKFSKKTIILEIAVVVVVIAAVLYFVAPGYLYNKAVDKLRTDAGLTIKSVNIPDFKIVYLEGGTGDTTIVMLHGFSASKDHWLRFSKYFTQNYHVIIPDLPGFGESSKPEDVKYNIMSQVERVNLLAKELKLTKFHIVGNSWGGNIAGNFTVAHPDMIKTLALFDASGVIPPIKSERDLLVEEGNNPYFFKSIEEYDKLFALNFYKPPKFPSLIKKYLAKQAMKAVPFNSKIYGDFKSDYRILHGKLKKITVPTLIVWGDSDKSIHVSAVQIYKKNIKKSQSAIIKECGHLPMLEKPQETASVYKDFLKGKN